MGSKTNPKMSTETETVGGNFAISSPHFESLVGYVNDRGGKIFEEKQLKLEELGLAELEDQPDHFQCLVCSKIIKVKGNAVRHFRKLHTNRNQTDFGTPENIFGTFGIIGRLCRGSRCANCSCKANQVPRHGFGRSGG